MSQFRLFLFGSPRLERGGEPIDITLRKALALLAYLAATKQSHSRDALATLLWPDDDQSKARGNLRRALSRINTALGKGQLAADRERAGLNPKANLWLDVDHFQRHLAECQTHDHPSNEVCADCIPRLTEAVSTYTNDFLAGFTLPDCPDFDEWQFFQSESLRQALASALERLVHGLSAQGEVELAIPHARRWLALDPLHEPAHRQLMELYAQSGQQAAAVRQYQECVRILDEELGIPPSEETSALYEAIKTKRFSPPTETEEQRSRGAREIKSFATLAPPPPDPSAPPHNLPPQPTPFIGREEELAALDDLIANPDVRLITIVGSGGIGKTRLALAAAERQLIRPPSNSPQRGEDQFASPPLGETEGGVFPDGIYFVNLASLSEVDHIAPALADALDLAMKGDGRSLQQQILDYLRQKEMLLVLDNFEHLLGGADLVVDILHTAPGVQILATSRERLHLQIEQAYPIEGLAFADWHTSQDAMAYAAVQLFLQSTRRNQPDLNLDDSDNLTYLARICGLVAGMPLAIELAASWVDMLSLADIATEIQQNLDFLETERRDMPERHRSIRATIDHSWRKLGQKEQDTFAQLSVFRGGFTRQAAQAVTNANLRLLSRLANKSLLQFDKTKDRYQIHELLRQYGSEKLEEAGETERLRGRHLAFFLKLAEEAEPLLESSDQIITWLNRLEIEHDNLRAALGWSRTAEGAAEYSLRLTGSLAMFWQLRGYFSEGREQLSAALSRTKASERTAARAKALYEAGRLAYVQSDFPAAGPLLEASISIYRELGLAGRLNLAHALIMLGDNETGMGDYTTAVSVIKEGLDIMRELEEASGIARALWKLGWCLGRQGDYEQASQHFTEALPLYRQIGDKGGLSMILAGLGEMALRQGEYGHATALLEESLALRRELGEKWGIAASLGTLAWVALRQGDLKQAVTLLAESMTLRQELGDRGGMAWCLEKLAEIALTQGQRESSSRQIKGVRWAARLFGAAEALRMPIGSVIDLVDRPEYERQLAIVRAQLDEATFAAAWAEGHQLTMAHAVKEALAVGEFVKATTLSRPVSSPPHNLPPQPTPFIGREEELAALNDLIANPDVRLITIVGPGGIGKTRLALVAEERQLDPARFPNGVYFVSLASVSGAEFMIPTIADGLNFSFFGQTEPKTQLLNYLREKQMLLVLDNFEHLLADQGTDLLSDIMGTAFQVKLLVTSRERLHLQEEWVIDLQGLAFPDEVSHEPPDSFSAVQLFLQRARQARSDFALAEYESLSVRRICRLVAGMPLALELAAAWVRLMSCREIAQEIERNLDFLSTSLRNVPDRHRSLRAVFEHSWQHLTEAERDVFKQLSVFRGGFLREAAEQVCGAALPILSTLVDKSLLVWNPSGRYELHELIRQYGAEKLDEDRRARENVQDAHCRYYAAFLQQKENSITGERQQETLAEIGADIENVRVGWRWAINQRQVAQIERYLEPLFRFYERRSWLQEGQEAFGSAAGMLSDPRDAVEGPVARQALVLGKVLARQGMFLLYLGLSEEPRELLQKSIAILRNVGPDGRGEMAFPLLYLGEVTWRRGAYQEAQQLNQEGLVIYRETGDRFGIALSLLRLGNTAYTLGKYPEAQQLNQESLTIFRELGDQWGIGFALNDLGLVAYWQGEYWQAKQYLQESVANFKESGSRWGMVFALGNLGRLMTALGDYVVAKQLLHEALALAREIGDQWGISFHLNDLAHIARLLGEYREAKQLGQKSLTLYTESGNRRGIAEALNNLGYVAYQQGQYGEARRLLEQGLTVHQEINGRRGIAETLNNLGRVALAIGNPEEARGYFHKALEIAMDIQARPVVLDVLAGVAAHLSGSGDGEKRRAVELLTLVQDHPATDHAAKEQAKRSLAEVASELPPDVFAAAQARGQTLDLRSTAAEVLKRLSKPSWGPVVTNNLPLQPTPFIGREEELAALDDLIADPDVRLITVVGPGGIGKTRLVLATAERQLETDLFPNGIYVVFLAALSAADNIVPTVANALDFRLETGGQTRSPKQQLLDYLRQKRMLLIMDNFEHLLSPPASPPMAGTRGGEELVADILQTAPAVQILVTSRERLQLQEEQVYPIRGLAFPDLETAKDVTEYPAIKLFLQSAWRIRPDYELGADELTNLTRLCRLVEGMPLGLELAASWVDMLSLADIAAEIQQSLNFLETETRNIPERHRSMRAVFDTSWQRLGEAERDIFSQLSVFRGGFSRKAAQEVTGTSLRLLATLANKSLLRYSKSRDRYEIHELLRQYGAEKLAEQTPSPQPSPSGRGSSTSPPLGGIEGGLAVRDRHSAYYCAALQQREADLKGSRQQVVLAEIEVDIENARAAWNWAVAQGQVERLRQALDSLGQFYEWQGRFQEGEAAFRRAAEKLASIEAGDEQGILTAKVLARVLAWQGTFSFTLGRPDSANQLLRKSLELLDNPGLANHDTRSERAFVLVAMGVIAFEAGDRQEARQLMEQSLALYQEVDDEWGMANALEKLSKLSFHLSTLNEARKFAEESLALRQALGDRRGIAKSLIRLGVVVLYQGQFEKSKQFLRRSIAIHRELGDLAGMASATHNLGSASQYSGEFDQARDLYVQTIAIFSNLGARQGIVADSYAIAGLTTMHLGRYKKAKPRIQTGLKLARELGDPVSIARALFIQGKLLLIEKDYAKAQQRLQESVTVCRAIGQRADLAWVLCNLSLTALNLGNISEAEQNAYEALQIATEIPTQMQISGNILPVTAYLLAKQGKKERAVELYALASRYPYVANSRWFEDVIGQRITAAAATLPPDITAAAQARGQALDLEHTMAELLEELSKWGRGEPPDSPTI